MQNLYLQRFMNKNTNCGFVKTKPIKPNSQSSTCAIGIVNNQLQRQTQTKPVLRSRFLLSLSEVGWRSRTNPITERQNINAFSRKACVIGRNFTMIITILHKFTSSLSPRFYPLGLQQGNRCLLAFLSGAKLTTL